MPTMNMKMAIRAARTSVTAAQNAGRIDGYSAAEKMGIKLKKQWMATLDSRTRHSHAMLDGVAIENDKTFDNGCRYPGDPNGSPEEVYNCRCTLIAVLDDAPYKNAERIARNTATGKNYIIKDMTYEEWENGKKSIATSKRNGIIREKGALTSKNDPNFSKRDSHAKKYYTSIRNSSKDGIVRAIEKNVDIDSITIDTAISHLFYTKHNLAKGFTYFDEDYDIAESVQRLRKGNVQPHDLILIQHEALEAKYMSNGIPFDKAHKMAESKYNYTIALRKYLEENNLE